MRIVIVTNMPAPYRNPIFKNMANRYHDDFLVIYSTKAEPNRTWKFDNLEFNHIYLKENIIGGTEGLSYIHNNPDVWSLLKDFNPDAIITTGFNPTHLYAWLFSVIHRKKHIVMTDGWIESEKKLTWVHRFVRKIVFATSHAFIGASKNSLDLYRSYNLKDASLFQSHLCVENSLFLNDKSVEHREYDLMFSGQFTARKMPLFFAEVVKKVKDKIPNIKILILGNGPLKDEFFAFLEKYDINFNYAGFVTQKELPTYYSNSKLFLFPTLLDAWGVVVNEAMASGTPVITTPYAGVVNDLIINNENGFILPTDIDTWASHAINILNSHDLWNIMSKNARTHVLGYNFEIATQGIIDAINYASKK